MKDLQLSPVWEGLIVSSLLIGAAFGAIVCGKLSDWIGRKRALLAITFTNLIGNICSSMAPSVGVSGI